MRFLLLTIIATTLILAQTGKEIFEKKCSSCHIEYIPQSKLLSNYKNDNEELNLTAPTATELSFALRDQIGERKADIESQLMEIEDFLISYCNKPDIDESIFADEIIDNFKTMPKIELTEDEAEKLSPYLFNLGENMIVSHTIKRYSYKEALQKAKAENKIVMIEGYIRFCRGCIKMDREVFVEEKVKKALNRDFVVVKKNMLLEKLPLGLTTLGTPAFYFITNDGKNIIDKIQGTGTVKEFLELLNGIKEDVKKKEFLKTK